MITLDQLRLPFVLGYLLLMIEEKKNCLWLVRDEEEEGLPSQNVLGRENIVYEKCITVCWRSFLLLRRAYHNPTYGAGLRS